MQATRPQSTIRRRFLQPGTALLAISVLLPAVLFAFAAWQTRMGALQDARVRVDRTIAVLHEHALKVFETHRLVIDQTLERLRTSDWDKAGSDAGLFAMLKRLQDSLDQVATITVTDAQGNMRASSRVFPATPAVNFADRDWFKATQAGPPDLLFIGQATIGRQSGQAVFNVAHRITGPDGEFRGAVAVSVDRLYFEKLYQALEPDVDHNVTLIRADGAILARDPPTPLMTLPADSPFLAAIEKDDMGTIDGASVIDGVDRLIAYRKVGPYPVYAAFGVSHRAALAGWWRNVAIYGFVAAMSALALLIASAFVLRQTDLWRQATADLQATAAAQARTEEQLRQSQKMEAVGRLTGGVAHDFNNLLTVVMGSLDLLKRRLKDGDERMLRLVDNALEGANRAASLTHRLLAFSRQQPLEPKSLDANKLVSGMSELLRRTLGESIEIETVLAGGLWPTFADPNQLESALLNLAVNARDAMPDGGKLTIETANGHLDEAYAAIRPDVTAGQYVMVCVSDTGTGMSPDVVARAFEPFFTTKPIGKGTGLGLSQVYGFAKQSFGHVTIYSEPGQGTTIKLYLPRHSGQSEAVPETAPQTIEPVFKGGGDKTVLVVEDEDLVRQFSVSALSEAGYRVLDAADGARALEIIDAHPEIALLFTDVVLMGAFNGRTLADAALKRRPDLKVLFTTGYTRNAIIHHGRLDEDVDFIGKPFNTPALVAKVRSVLAAAAVDGAPKA